MLEYLESDEVPLYLGVVSADDEYFDVVSVDELPYFEVGLSDVLVAFAVVVEEEVTEEGVLVLVVEDPYLEVVESVEELPDLVSGVVLL